MTTLYLIRHAESTMNAHPELIGGRSNDVELTPHGIDQAQRLGASLRNEDCLPVRVYSSPAVRSLATARVALETMGAKLPVTQDERLIEMDQGTMVGQTRASVYTPDILAEIARQGKDFTLPGGESMDDVGTRLKGWIDDIELVDGVSLVFTHGVAIRCLVSALEQWSHEATYESTVPNVSLTRIDRSDNRWVVRYVGRPIIEPVQV